MKICNEGKNALSLIVGGLKVLFSYGVPVAAHMAGEGYFARTDVSPTSKKHINQFLDGHKAKEIAGDSSFFDNLLTVSLEKEVGV